MLALRPPCQPSSRPARQRRQDLPGNGLSRRRDAGGPHREGAAATQGRPRNWAAGRGGVFVVETSGSATPRQLCESCSAVGWLSDSRRLLVFRGQPERRVIVFDTDTGESREVEGTSDLRMEYVSGGQTHVDASGRWIAGRIRSPEGLTTLSMIPWDELQAGAEIIDSHTGRFPQWHPSGRALFFLSSHEGSVCLSAIRLDTDSKQPLGEPFVVRHFRDRGFPLRGQYSISDDRVFVGIHETKGNIWMMEPGRVAQRAARGVWTSSVLQVRSAEALRPPGITAAGFLSSTSPTQVSPSTPPRFERQEPFSIKTHADQTDRR